MVAVLALGLLRPSAGPGAGPAERPVASAVASPQAPATPTASTSPAPTRASPGPAPSAPAPDPLPPAAREGLVLSAEREGAPLPVGGMVMEVFPVDAQRLFGVSLAGHMDYLQCGPVPRRLGRVPGPATQGTLNGAAYDRARGVFYLGNAPRAQVRRWKLSAEGKPEYQPPLQHSEQEARPVAVLPDGRVLVGGDRRISVWSPEGAPAGELRIPDEVPGHMLMLVPGDGVVFASRYTRSRGKAAGSLHRLELATGKHARVPIEVAPFGLDLSADRRFLAVGDARAQLHVYRALDLELLWSAPTRELEPGEDHAFVHPVAWTHDGTFVLSGDARGVVRVFRARSGGAPVFAWTAQPPLSDGRPDWVTKLVIREPRVYTGGNWGEVNVWLLRGRSE
ncbi:MAG: WD40 repeat domain-containing protein [Planctomycetota bacterium]